MQIYKGMQNKASKYCVCKPYINSSQYCYINFFKASDYFNNIIVYCTVCIFSYTSNIFYDNSLNNATYMIFLIFYIKNCSTVRGLNTLLDGSEVMVYYVFFPASPWSLIPSLKPGICIWIRLTCAMKPIPVIFLYLLYVL